MYLLTNVNDQTFHVEGHVSTRPALKYIDPPPVKNHCAKATSTFGLRGFWPRNKGTGCRFQGVMRGSCFRINNSAAMGDVARTSHPSCIYYYRRRRRTPHVVKESVSSFLIASAYRTRRWQIARCPSVKVECLKKAFIARAVCPHSE